MTGLTLPLLSKRRQGAQLVQKVQHAVPSVALLGHGAVRLTHDGDWLSIALGASEVVVSTLVIISFVRAVRSWRGHEASTSTAAHGEANAPPHGHIDWVDIFIGLMLAVEVWAHWHETGHIQRPTLLLVPIMIGLGLGHGWVDARSRRRRSLRVDDTGIAIRGRFTRFEVSWADVKSIDIGAAEARIVARSGRTRALDLADLTNGADIRHALEQARAELSARALPPTTAAAAGVAS